MSKVTNKLDNNRLLKKYPKINPYLPMTLPFSEESLTTMLNQFPFVYLKPIDSYQGKGLMRVDHLCDDEFLLRTRDTKSETVHSSIPSLIDEIKTQKMKRYYLIQQGIDSITPSMKPFDIRVHLLRINRKWDIVGIVVRMAEPGGIVTNAYSGGTSHFIGDVFVNELNFCPQKNSLMLEQLNDLSLRVTRTISRFYPSWNEFGLDIGLDSNGKYWLYEVNITPGGLVFKNLDRDVYRNLRELRKIAS